MIEPLSDKLLVRQFKAKDKTDGGIVLPEQAKLRPMKGTVLAIGPGKIMEDGKYRPMNVKVGDVVLFGKYAAAITVEVDGEELILMNEPDVLAREIPKV
jgi:chaperonin GroES